MIEKGDVYRWQSMDKHPRTGIRCWIACYPFMPMISTRTELEKSGVKHAIWPAMWSTWDCGWRNLYSKELLARHEWHQPDAWQEMDVPEFEKDMIA